MVVVCDRSLITEYFKAKESSMSLYDVLTELYFADAFSDDPRDLPTIINLVKKTIAVRFDEFIPKIKGEAEKMIERLRKKSGKIALTDEMIRFVACTSARCFVNLELSDEIYDQLMEFTHLLNKLVVWTYFLPRPWIKFLMGTRLSQYRKKITSHLQPIIQEYRENQEKNDSLLLREAVDYVDEQTGNILSDQQIGDIIVCLLYVSSENTALGLSNTVTDLASHGTYWDQVKELSSNLLSDPKSLFASPLLNACILESARMNSHIFALNRKPTTKKTLGDYYLGDVETVALCEPMLMSHECSLDTFKNPLIYRPERYLEDGEPSDAKNVMTWGAGVHLCPGKLFALYEIKMATALMTTHFKIELDSKLPPLNYFSPSAFAERQVLAKLTPIETSIKKNETVEIGGYSVQALPEGAWLIRGAMTPQEQREFYDYTIRLSEGSVEHQEILTAPMDRAYPVTYYKLAYTGTSNCEFPDKWLWWANQLAHEFKIQGGLMNSLYAQLYGLEGKMKVHKDEHVSWGISVNLGASCDFLFGEQTYQLHSGDVFIADFSKTDHAVLRIHDNTTPGWFTEQSKNFGRVRCSVQIRHVDEQFKETISNEEFKKMLLK